MQGFIVALVPSAHHHATVCTGERHDIVAGIRQFRAASLKNCRMQAAGCAERLFFRPALLLRRGGIYRFTVPVGVDYEFKGVILGSDLSGIPVHLFGVAERGRAGNQVG